MERYVNYLQLVEDGNYEILVQKRTDSTEPEYQIEVRNDCDESLLTLNLAEAEYVGLVKAANALKREQ